MKTTAIIKRLPVIPLWAIAGLTLFLSAWWLVRNIQKTDLTIGEIDPGIIQVIGLALVAWLLILAIAFILIGKLLVRVMIQVNNIFEPIKTLSSWQYYVLYLALFALLVLSGTGCLIAIC